MKRIGLMVCLAVSALGGFAALSEAEVDRLCPPRPETAAAHALVLVDRAAEAR